MAVNTGFELTDLLRRERSIELSESGEQQGDAALLAEGWERALLHYEDCDDGSARVAEKKGWCLCRLERWAEAREILSPIQPSLSALSLAFLAVAYADGWDNTHQLSADAKNLVEATIRASLARSDTPPIFAYATYFWFAWALSVNDKYDIAVRAVTHYPKWRAFRLQWAYQTWSVNPSEDIYDALTSCLDEEATAEYVGACARAAIRVGRYADAANHVSVLETRLGEDEKESIFLIRLWNAHLLVRAGDVNAARERYNALKQDSHSFDNWLRLDLHRHLAELARLEGDKVAQQEALQSLLSIWLEDPIKFHASRIVDGEDDVVRFSDGTIVSPDTFRALSEHEEAFLSCLEGHDRGLLRFLFAEARRCWNDDYDRRAYATSIIQAREETTSSLLDGAYALACTLKKSPNWRAAGSTWARYASTRFESNQTRDIEEPLTAESPPSDTALLAYAEGMLSHFKTSPSRRNYEIFSENLREALLDRKLYPIFRRLADACVFEGGPIGALFDAGLGADYCNEKGRAEELYWTVLADSPAHYSALYNVMLLCRNPASTPSLQRVAGLVEAFPSDRSEQKQKLLEALGRAKNSCQDPAEVARQAVRNELARYSALIQKSPGAASISLRSALTLRTLFLACGAPSESLVLDPFENTSRPFSPTTVHRRGLFGLLESGLVSIAGNCPLNAFAIENGRVSSYYFHRCRWQISPSTLILSDEIQATAALTWWPKAWCEDVRTLVQALAEEEVIQYIHHAADERGWPPPNDEEKTRALAKGLLRHMSVSEAFYLIYLGAMSAADYKAKKPINDQQASNAIILRTSQRLDRWVGTPWPLKSFSRTNDVPRSWFSTVLHDEFLKVGEKAFTGLLDQLPFPQPRGRRKATEG